MTEKIITLKTLIATKRSVSGRLSRIYTKSGLYGQENTPINEIGVFSNELKELEEVYAKMQKRLDNAKITIDELEQQKTDLQNIFKQITIES